MNLKQLKIGPRPIPQYFTLLGAIASCYLLSSTALRIVLYIAFGQSASVTASFLPILLLIGLLNDLIETVYLLFPLALMTLIVWNPLRRLKLFPYLLRAGLWCTFFATIYLCITQYYFFKEYDARFNLVAVDYLIYPHEVFINIWESYPVATALCITALISFVLVRLVVPVIDRQPDRAVSAKRALLYLGGHTALVTFCGFFLSTHTFDFSTNRVANELAADGISSFFQAFHTNHLNYEQFYRTADPEKLKHILTEKLASGSGAFSDNPNSPWLQRSFTGSTEGLGKLNVVVITEESFGCEQIDSCGKGIDIDSSIRATADRKTPYFDKLAHKGWFFTKAYATGTRTVRGLEAISASFPPIPSESIIKRPGNDHIATWGKVMQENGYSSSFLYGGYGQFDNMTTYFSGNGFEVKDRMSIDNPKFANIWGVSDQDLFNYATKYFDTLDQGNKPFFSILMTTSNHSPFTYPEGVPGVPPKGGGRNAGIRYADFALGEFLNKAQGHSWFKNTLFIVVADHGARVYGKAKIPLNSYEIPILFYAPAHLSPKQIAQPISQMDIAPTVLGLLGLPYSAPFFGQNVFTEKQEDRVLLFNHNHDVALYANGRLVVLGLQNEVSTYSYTLGDKDYIKISEDPTLTELAVSYFQTAFQLFTTHAYK